MSYRIVMAKQVPYSEVWIHPVWMKLYKDAMRNRPKGMTIDRYMFDEFSKFHAKVNFDTSTVIFDDEEDATAFILRWS